MSYIILCSIYIYILIISIRDIIYHNIISYYIHPGVGKNTLHFKLSWLSSLKILQFHKKNQWKNLLICFTTAGKNLSSTTVTLGQAINFLPFRRLDTQICSIRRVTIWVDTESWHRCVRSVLEWKHMKKQYSTISTHKAFSPSEETSTHHPIPLKKSNANSSHGESWLPT